MEMESRTTTRGQTCDIDSQTNLFTAWQISIRWSNQTLKEPSTHRSYVEYCTSKFILEVGVYGIVTPS